MIEKLEQVRIDAPTFLVVAGTLGYFGLVALFFFHPPVAESREVLTVAFGVIGNAWGGIVGFYFGSSHEKAKAADVAAAKKDAQ